MAYSHRTFPPTIFSVGLLSGALCKTADRIWVHFLMVGQMGPGTRQVVGSGDRCMPVNAA